jgi:hypothetical protein
MTAKAIIFTGKIETRAQLAQLFHGFRESNQITYSQSRAAVDSLACYLPAELTIEQRMAKSVITCTMPAGKVEVNNRSKVRIQLTD